MWISYLRDKESDDKLEGGSKTVARKVVLEVESFLLPSPSCKDPSPDICLDVK